MNSISEAFARHAAERREIPAVCDAVDSVSYRDLERWSARIASELIENLGTQPSVCALIGHNTSAGVAGVLGVLRTPHMLVTLDAETPLPAAMRILEDLGAELCLHTDAGRSLSVALQHGRDIRLLPVEPYRWREDVSPWRGTVPINSRCAIKLTSGTTGARKGIEITQAAEVFSANRGAGISQIVPGSILATCALIDTTAGRSSMLRTLLAGGTYLPCDLRHEPIAELATRLVQSEITHFHGPTTTFRLLASALSEGSLKSLTCAHLSGERVTVSEVELVAKLASPECLVSVVYGATEFGIAATCSAPAGETVSLGALPRVSPVTGVKIDIVDKEGCVLPGTASGYVRITSPGVALGYRSADRDGSTEHFPQAEDGMRIFVTEDRGRLGDDGKLVLEGRSGTEAKIRGRRVDPFDIEHWLLSRPEVDLAAVVIQNRDDDTRRRLVAVVVPAAGYVDPSDALRSAMGDELPSHSQISKIILRRDLPLTSSGKLDRREIEQGTYEAERQDPLVLPKEYRLLGELWHQVLGVHPKSNDQSFFALGGDSLAAAQLSLAIEARLRRRVDLGFAYRCNTLREQIAALKTSVALPLEVDRLLVPLVGEGVANAKQCFVVSGAGGHVYPFVPVAQLLAEHGWEMTGILHPRFRLEEPQCADIKALADRTLKALRSAQHTDQVFIVGYSIGGLVAHEVASRLEAEGASTGVAMIDTQNVSELPTLYRTRRNIIAALRSVRASRISNRMAPESRLVAARLLGRKLSNNYTPGRRVGPMAMIRADGTPRNGLGEDLGWRDLVTELETYTVPGDHISLFKGTNLPKFCDALVNALEGLRIRLPNDRG